MSRPVNTPEWTDEEGQVWEFWYIVTHTEEEGPEYMLFRKQGSETWHEWPMFVEPPYEVASYFFGPSSSITVSCSLNSVQIGNCLSFLTDRANGVTELRNALQEARERLQR